MKNAIFWDVMPCSSCRNRLFGGKQRLHHQDYRIAELGMLAVTSNRRKLRRKFKILSNYYVVECGLVAAVTILPDRCLDWYGNTSKYKQSEARDLWNTTLKWTPVLYTKFHEVWLRNSELARGDPLTSRHTCRKAISNVSFYLWK
jgi:hypothetical protein